MEVTISTEQARGCGYRKPAKDGVGIYLVGDGLGAPCGLLPVPLGVCPCCGGGIKQTRGWTWITPQSLFTDAVLGSVAGIERDCDRSRRLKTLVAGFTAGGAWLPRLPGRLSAARAPWAALDWGGVLPDPRGLHPGVGQAGGLPEDQGRTAGLRARRDVGLSRTPQGHPKPRHR